MLLTFPDCACLSRSHYLLPFQDDTSTVHGKCVNGTAMNPCQCVDLPVTVCQVYWSSQLIFSLFFLVWNLLVAVVLVSVARTQVEQSSAAQLLRI